jgi:hypothetical protein
MYERSNRQRAEKAFRDWHDGTGSISPPSLCSPEGFNDTNSERWRHSLPKTMTRCECPRAWRICWTFPRNTRQLPMKAVQTALQYDCSRKALALYQGRFHIRAYL